MPTVTIDIPESVLQAFPVQEREAIRSALARVATSVDTAIASLTLDDLSDVSAAAPLDTQVLTYDSGDGLWEAANGGGGAETLEDLTDVTIASVATRDELEWNGSAWVNKNPFPQIVTESTTSRTSVLTDAGSYIRFTNGSATSFQIPPQSSVAWRDGAQIEFEQGGAGAVTVSGGSGVTIRVNANLTAVTNGQYAVAGLKRVASDEWVLFGNLVAA